MAAGVLVLVVAGCGGGATTVVRTVTTPAWPPRGRLSLAHRDPEAPRVEPGHRPRSEAGCVEPRGGRVKAVVLRSAGETCARVAPRDRLLFVNAVGVGHGPGEPEPIEVDAGPFSAYAPTEGSAVFAAPVGTYLALGLHRVETTAGATAPLVLVLPEGCRVKDTRPGESLCFAGHRPPCKASDLRVRTARGGAGLGTYYGHDLLVNRSARVCTVSGFPHVVPLDSRGRPVVPKIPARPSATTMSGNHPRTIALEPGAAATFEINTTAAANYSRSACLPRKAATLRIHIPGAGSGTLSVPYGMELCSTGSNATVGRIE